MNLEVAVVTQFGGVEEGARFCYYCGGLLDPYLGLHASHTPNRRTCRACGADWTRVLSEQGCAPCEGGFVHIGAPTDAEVEGAKVVAARGLAWCDRCNGYMSYFWRGGKFPTIAFLGFDREGRVQSSLGLTRTWIGTDA
jgi:hypothetical protein